MQDENIIILKICGGIGNQLFQIANAIHLSTKFNRKLLISDKNSSSRKTYWDSIFNPVKPFLITNNEYQELRKQSKNYNWAATRFEYKEIILDPQISCYNIDGYYQSYKYFDIESFKKYLNLEYNQNKYTIHQSDIAIHIRRTDYAQNNFHKLLSLDYYYNSIHKHKKQNIIENIYVFSDDINWCKKNFKVQNITYVELDNEIQELIFMSKFNSIIIANSTFSWWACFLGNPTNVYCPKNWFINGCHLNTKDLRPNNWHIIDDTILQTYNKFDKNTFNVISLGSACCMVQNIHDNIYKHLGPLYKQSGNETNFFDWLIVDFKSILYIFNLLSQNDDTFLNNNNFTIENVNAESNKLSGGWKTVYRKIENKSNILISLHDVKKNIQEIPPDFFEKYKRRFHRLYKKIIENDNIFFMHTIDFQWMKPYFPSKDDIILFFNLIHKINPKSKPELYIFIHPSFEKQCREIFLNNYNIQNLNICYLKNKGFHSDWKADNLTFDQFISL
tara:strand:+ start:434 stop:1942 length:1509 start_codon:yes stop_codon:yes gene_type:complete